MGEAHKLLDLADSFREVAHMANKSGCALESHSMIMAGAVNAALALEYFAKCLNKVEIGQFEKTHDLCKLASKLPANVRMDLEARYAANVSDDERARAQSSAALSKLPIDDSFDEVLANWSKVFVDGRYWFEPASAPQLHWFFFEPLAVAYRSLILPHLAGTSTQ